MTLFSRSKNVSPVSKRGSNLYDLYRTGTGSQGTPGTLFLDGELLIVTLELPWKNNRRNVSCILAGTFPIKIHNSPKFGRCAMIYNVPARGDILIHWGNWAGDKSLDFLSDTLGCVLTGTVFGSLDEQRAVRRSKIAFDKFMTSLEAVGESTITIHDLFEV